MRFNDSSPAGQLGSVSQRYQHPLAGAGSGTSSGSASGSVASRTSVRRNGAGQVTAVIAAAATLAAVGADSAGRYASHHGPVVKYEPVDGRRRPSEAVALDPRVPVERDERLSRLEAVLLLAKEPLHPRKLSKFANLADGTEALTLVSRLNHLYDRAPRAFRVEEVAGGWQLRTRPQFASWLRRLQHVPRALRLSSPAMETLAVVAYRQPAVRVDVEAVRGVACGEILRQLMERGLVRVSGRSEELGRPYFYSTTQRFLQEFGLRSLEELPRAEWFRQALNEEAVANGVDVAEEASLDDEDDLEEEDAWEADEEDEDEDEWDEDEEEDDE